jgi:hypothetical protein
VWRARTPHSIPRSDSSGAYTTVVAVPIGAWVIEVVRPALCESLEPTAAMRWPSPSRRSYSAIAVTVNGFGEVPNSDGPVAIS